MSSVVALHPVTIRQAQIQDLPEILGCLKAFWEESPWKVLKPEPDLVYVAEWLMKLDGRSNLFLAEEDGALVGVCGGTIVEFPMIADLSYLWEWALWVAPEYRHTGTGNRLWGALIDWAKEHGAKGCMRGKAEAVTEKIMREALHWRWF